MSAKQLMQCIPESNFYRFTMIPSCRESFLDFLPRSLDHHLPPMPDTLNTGPRAPRSTIGLPSRCRCFSTQSFSGK